jgi:hypothetical protein
MGYQVIEEYMRQGQAFARAAWAPYMPQERPEGGDARALTERMFQYASDLATVWLQYVQVMTAQTSGAGTPKSSSERAAPGAGIGGFDLGTKPAAPTEPPAWGGRPVGKAGAPDGASTQAASGKVSIEIACRRRAKVNVDLRGPIANASPCAHDLRARDSSLPRITEVSIETAPPTDDVLVRIVVPDEQPPATYSGLIVDDITNLPMGTLTVQILE